MENKFEIEKLQFKDGFSMCVAAPRRSGKTVLIKDLVRRIGFRFDVIIFKSLSQTSLEDYHESFGDQIEFNDGKKVAIGYGIYKPGDRTIKKLSKNRGSGAKILVVMDDILSKKTKNDDGILDLYVHGRHQNVSCIFSSQRVTYIDPTVRENSDIFIVLNANTGSTLEFIIKELLEGTKYDNIESTIGMKKGEAKVFNTELVRKCTEGYSAMVFDNINGRIESYTPSL